MALSSPKNYKLSEQIKGFFQRSLLSQQIEKCYSNFRVLLAENV